MATRATLVFYLFAVLALVYIVAGVNAATCKTNGGSPTVNDANCAVNYISGLGNSDCCQHSCSGDFCQQEIDCGTARARMCGNCNQCVSCSTEANSLRNIVSQCSSNGRVAGSEFAGGYEFQIITRPNLEEVSTSTS